MARLPYSPSSVSTAQRDALGAMADGVLVWNSTIGCLQFAKSGAWVNLGAGSIWWQHPRPVALPTGINVPLPWNSPFTDPLGVSPGYHVLTAHVAATSDNVALPATTIHLDAIPAGPPTPPTTGFVCVTGPSGSRTVADGVTTNASPTVTSATAAFVAGDVHSLIGGAGIPSPSYIGVRNSATSIALSSSATANVPVNGTASASGVTLAISSQTDTIAGYTAISAPDLTGTNSTGGAVFTTGISTGTLHTGQLVTWANVQFDTSAHVPIIWNGLAEVAFSADATAAQRTVRWRDATSSFHFVGSALDVPSLNVVQHVIVPMQTAGGLNQVEAYQNSGAVLTSALDGIQGPSLMMDVGSSI